MYRFTDEEYALMMRFLELGDPAVLGTEAPKKLLYLAERFNNQLLKVCTGQAAKAQRLSEKLDRLMEKREERFLAGEDLTELGLDSGLVFRALYYTLWALTKGEWKVGVTKTMYIFFDLYASWLYIKKERICVERPVAQESGPWFWGAIAEVKKNNLSPLACKCSWEKLTSVNPAVAAAVKSIANKYYATRESDLKSFVCKCAAWKEATKDKNGGKWNKVLDDGKIYLWRKDLEAVRRQQQ